MTDTDERLTRVETKLDVLAEQREKRCVGLEARMETTFTRLESHLMWLFTLQMMWMTILIGLAIAVLKR
jgi:hypothetical protein